MFECAFKVNSMVLKKVHYIFFFLVLVFLLNSAHVFSNLIIKNKSFLNFVCFRKA